VIDVATAENLVFKNALMLKAQALDLESLPGRVLAQDIYATREQPPFDRVMMDGMAINFQSLEQKKYQIIGMQKAGESPLTLENINTAIEVMTGAVLPLGTDTIIPYEDFTLENNIALISAQIAFKKGQFIHAKGSDHQQDVLLLKKGTKLNAPAISLLAGQGYKHVDVFAMPKVAIISTGDELKEPGEECESWEIWRSNPFALRAELMSFGIAENSISLFHLLDNKTELFHSLKSIIAQHDLIIISGGVSKGKYDFVDTALKDMGLNILFHQVKQKPGKPLLFATDNEGKNIFGLPGNPVSALVNLRRFIIPSLAKSLALDTIKSFAALNKAVSFKKDFTLFKTVQVGRNENGLLIATPIDGNTSGDFTSLALSSGFLQLPAHENTFAMGNCYPFYPWS